MNDTYTRTGTDAPMGAPAAGEHNAAGDTAILNTLIGTLLDSIDGYEKSAADADNQQLAGQFTARAAERQGAVRTLQSAVTALGGKPEDDGTLLGAAHRAFVSLREAVSARDDAAIVAEVERGEDYLKAKFEAASEHADLSTTARAAIADAYASVKSGHDAMSQLKHTMVAPTGG